jgi:hypothetical protein
MAGYRLKISALDEHAHAIGYLCMRWAMLEQRLHHCLDDLKAFPDEKTGECLTSNTDLRTRIDMLRGVAFLRKPSDKWYEEFSALLNRIDSEMRCKRNRYIHDMWLHANVPSPVKRKRGVKVAKAPATGVRSLTTYTDDPVSHDDIWNFVYQVERVSTRLALFSEFDPAAFNFAETWP